MNMYSRVIHNVSWTSLINTATLYNCREAFRPTCTWILLGQSTFQNLYNLIQHLILCFFFFYLTSVLHRSQEYFIYTMVANIKVGGNRAVHGRNPRPSVHCFHQWCDTWLISVNFSKVFCNLFYWKKDHPYV